MYEGEPTPEQISLALGAGVEDENTTGPTFEKLKQSILTTGGVINPVILNRQADGTLVCIEGNTRVSLYKSFRAQGIPGNWATIPSLVHDELSAADMDAIRLQAHLVGPRQWDPYSKAKYLHELRTKDHLPWSVIIDYCGGNKKDLAESITAFEDMEEFYRPILAPDEGFDPTRFSGFIELQKTGIKQAIASAGFDLSDFAVWVKQQKIYPLNTVRQLPRILRNAETKKVFLKEGARRAAQLLEKPDLSKTLLDADIEQLARAIVEKILKITFGDFQKLRSDPDQDLQQSVSEAIEQLRALLQQLDREESD
jgi:hypothetical protein